MFNANEKQRCTPGPSRHPAAPSLGRPRSNAHTSANSATNYPTPPMSTDAMKQRYVELLKTHDWSFEYSDDNNMYLRGKTQRNEIEELAKHVDPDHTIYNQHAPKDYQK